MKYLQIKCNVWSLSAYNELILRLNNGRKNRGLINVGIDCVRPSDNPNQDGLHAITVNARSSPNKTISDNELGEIIRLTVGDNQLTQITSIKIL